MTVTKKKVLIVIENALDIGGVQNVIMCMVRRLNEHFDFDIVVTNKKQGYYDKEFSNYGKIFIIERRKKTSILNMLKDEKQTKKRIREILCNENYHAIYCNNMFNAGVFLQQAKKCGVPIRIAHSQIGSESKVKFYSRILYAIKRKKINKNSTDLLAVTKNSADSLFGKNNKALIVKNPVFDVQEYCNILDNTKKDKVKILHLGYLASRKNAMFSVEIMEKLVKIDNKFYLTIAGNGDANYIQLVKNAIEQKGLSEHINFIPDFVDVKEELSKHNYLILPSLGEGLPCVLLQGQAVGLPCFVSDKVERICDQGICEFLPLEKGAEFWANNIYEYYKQNGQARRNVDMSDWELDNICKCYKNLFDGKGFTE